MAFSCCLGLTLVPLLKIPFNTILYFSNNFSGTYLPNTLQHSRYIYQKGQSFLKSPIYTIQFTQTVLFVSGPNIIFMDNNSNWKDAPTTNPTTNLISNRLNSSTYLWLKLCQSNNTNEQLANVLSWLRNTLNANQTLSPHTNSKRTKAYTSDTFSSTKPNKFNNFLFQYHLYFCTNPIWFYIDIVKINFAITYLTVITQDWFED